MALITLGPMVIAIPEGADFSTLEGLKRSMLLLETRHFISPFLAHALSSLAGEFFAVNSFEPSNEIGPRDWGLLFLGYYDGVFGKRTGLVYGCRSPLGLSSEVLFGWHFALGRRGKKAH